MNNVQHVLQYFEIQTLLDQQIYKRILFIQSVDAVLLLCIALFELVKYQNKCSFVQYMALAIFVFVETFTKKNIVKTAFISLLISKMMVGFQNYLIELGRKGRVQIEAKLRENEPNFLSTKTIALFASKDNFVDYIFIWKRRVYMLLIFAYGTMFLLSAPYAHAMIDLHMALIALYISYHSPLPANGDKKVTEWKKDAVITLSETVGFIITYWSYPVILCFFDVFLFGIFGFLICTFLSLSFLIIHRYTCSPLTHIV